MNESSIAKLRMKGYRATILADLCETLESREKGYTEDAKDNLAACTSADDEGAESVNKDSWRYEEYLKCVRLAHVCREIADALCKL